MKLKYVSVMASMVDVWLVLSQNGPAPGSEGSDRPVFTVPSFIGEVHSVQTLRYSSPVSIATKSEKKNMIYS